MEEKLKVVGYINDIVETICKPEDCYGNIGLCDNGDVVDEYGNSLHDYLVDLIVEIEYFMNRKEN